MRNLLDSASQSEGHRQPPANRHPEVPGSPPAPAQHQAEGGGCLDRDLPQVRHHLDPGARLEHRQWSPGGRVGHSHWSRFAQLKAPKAIYLRGISDLSLCLYGMIPHTILSAPL